MFEQTEDQRDQLTSQDHVTSKCQLSGDSWACGSSTLPLPWGQQEIRREQDHRRPGALDTANECGDVRGQSCRACWGRGSCLRALSMLPPH